MQPLKYYFKRARELGFTTSLKRLKKRLEDKISSSYWRYTVTRKKAAHTWPVLSSVNHLPSSFALFLSHVRAQTFIEDIKKSAQFQRSLPEEYATSRMIEMKRNELKHNTISLLGAHLTFEDHTKIPWQKDFRYHSLMLPPSSSSNAPLIKAYPDQPNWHKKASLFYKDVTIDSPEKIEFHEYAPDIKIPWELSRMQHLVPLFIGDDDQERGAHIFFTHINSWIDENPLMLGANWVCPMDVGLRAINLIWGFHTFKNSPSIPPTFWEKLTCSLYDHAYYLERNWETSDKPSNHYLSDLVGYFYLCVFFDAIDRFKQKREWCFNEIIAMVHLQFHQDGSNYEGSTHYHKLVTELFFHFYLACLAKGYSLPASFIERLCKAISFLADCIDTTGSLIQIGDNDSGKVLAGITSNRHNLHAMLTLIAPEDTVEKYSFQGLSTWSLKHYPNFGLTILQKKGWHISLRHPSFQAHQPSGHFHYDELSCTLSINDRQILVDPGSYLYTANAAWRNALRSEANHSTVYLKQSQSFDSHLFQLNRPVHKDNTLIHEEKHVLQVTTFHQRYASFGTVPWRCLRFQTDSLRLSITDWWEQKNSSSNAYRVSCTFVFHPTIILHQEDATLWSLWSDNRIVAFCKSTIPLQKEAGWYSPTFGVVHETTKLEGTYLIHETSSVEIFPA